MNSIEVVVAAMNQNDFSLVEKMKIKSCAVIANQCSYNSIKAENINNYQIKLISTSTRGVGLNRNLGLLFATGDILLFSDEDALLVDGYQDIVREAFDEFPNADLICFGIEFTLNNQTYKTRIPRKGKLPFRKSLKFGTCSVAVKRSSLEKKNIFFSHLFGGGCLFSHGEDSDFIIQCYRKRLSVYSFDKIICKTAKDTSTCFEGYNEKYFYDAGALARHTFKWPLRILYMVYIALRIKDSQLSLVQKMRYLRAGAKGFKSLTSYQAFTELSKH